MTTWPKFLGSSVVKNPFANARDERDLGSITRVGNGNLLQYSCLEISRDRGSWQATVHGVAKSQTQLSRHKHFKHIEKKFLEIILNKYQISNVYVL